MFSLVFGSTAERTSYPSLEAEVMEPSFVARSMFRTVFATVQLVHVGKHWVEVYPVVDPGFGWFARAPFRYRGSVSTGRCDTPSETETRKTFTSLDLGLEKL